VSTTEHGIPDGPNVVIRRPNPGQGQGHERAISARTG
jgi:hypothetical protein